MKYSVGVDVGGTFTDLVAVDENGNMTFSKVPSIPDDSSIGVMNAIKQANIDLRDVNFFVHGATVGANTIIEHKGAKTAIITTKGFRDNLELRRGRRVIDKPTDMYNLQMDLPQDYVGGYSPLVSRQFRYEVPERSNYKGEVVKPLDEKAIRRIADDLKKNGIQAVAICYLFSFLNSKHEQRTAEILRELLPALRISLSSEILPVIREYERLSTTVLNAYIMPKMQTYIENLRDKLRSRGFGREYYIMQSNGGIMSSHTAGQRPVYTIDSGPAGGVSAATNLGELINYPDLIAFDMGGTTTKVCVIHEGKPAVTTNYWADGKYFSGAPIIDMVEIGAGGGSICWLDTAKSVYVGPQSAGAKPGPACYKLGGTEPTITDAIMTLGYINPDYFLGGDMKVDVTASRSVIQKKIADKLGVTLTEAAHGIYRLASANMIGAIRIVTVQRGFDPRDFTLAVFGGTGAVFAIRLAQELHIPRVLVPMVPGCFSALGLITSDASYDVFRSYVVRITRAEPDKMQAIFDKMEEEAANKIVELGFKKSDVQLRHKIAMRYEGQAHEVSIELPPGLAGKKLTRETLTQYEKMFHEKHKYLYGHSSPEATCEFFTLSVSAIGLIPKARMSLIKRGTTKPSQAFKGNRKVFWPEYQNYTDTPTYERSKLKAGNIINGPAIIEQMDTTAVIPPWHKAKVDKYGTIIIKVKPQNNG